MKYTLSMSKAEAEALMEIYVRGMNTVKRSGPDEITLVDKLVKLGNELEDGR
jgi:hypothetical protein